MSTKKLKNICVYCGSGTGHDTAFAEAAYEFGKILASQGIGLVYGGGSLGLMGIIASSVLEHGGYVTGIIPDFLSKREHMLENAQEVIVVKTMHQRKQLMFTRADAFVAFPGGLGTLEEFVEQLTWAQLGRHEKPIVLVNLADFWRPLLTMFDQMKAESFIRPGLELRLQVIDSVDKILPAIEAALAAQPSADEEALAEAQVTAKF